MVTGAGRLCPWQFDLYCGAASSQVPRKCWSSFCSGEWKGPLLTGCSCPKAQGCLEQRNIQSYGPHLVSPEVSHSSLHKLGILSTPFGLFPLQKVSHFGSVLFESWATLETPGSGSGILDSLSLIICLCDCSFSLLFVFLYVSFWGGPLCLSFCAWDHVCYLHIICL